MHRALTQLKSLYPTALFDSKMEVVYIEPTLCKTLSWKICPKLWLAKLLSRPFSYRERLELAKGASGGKGLSPDKKKP